MKQIFFIATLIAIAFHSNAQDRLYTHSSDTLVAKILEIRNDTIFLKKTVNNRSIQTFIERNSITDYHYDICDKLTEGALYKFILNDESVIFGHVKNIGKDSISLHTSFSNTITIYNGAVTSALKQNIDIPVAASIITLNPVQIEDQKRKTRNTTFLKTPNPHYTRYFFAPSAYSIPKGKGYYQNAYVVVNSVNYGLTNHFSVGGGIEFISTFSGNPTLFASPKLGYKLGEKFGVSIGAIGGVVFGEDAAGIGSINGTYGTIESNLTLGLGWGFYGDEYYKQPIINLNGMTRIGKRFSLITENWIVPQHNYDYPAPYYQPVITSTQYTPFISYGFRYFKDKISIDFAFINSKDIADFIFIGIPYIDFVILF